MMPARPPGRQMLGHVVHKQHLAALGLHREAVVGPDAALGRHERRIGQNHVGVFVPTLLAGQRVIFKDVWGEQAVQIHIDQRQPHHVGRDVVAPKVGGQRVLFVRGQPAVAVLVGAGFQDVFVR